MAHSCAMFNFCPPCQFTLAEGQYSERAEPVSVFRQAALKDGYVRFEAKRSRQKWVVICRKCDEQVGGTGLEIEAVVARGYLCKKCARSVTVLHNIVAGSAEHGAL